MNEILLSKPVKSVFIPLQNRLSYLPDKSDLEIQIKELCDKAYNEGYDEGVVQGQRQQEAVSGVEIQQLKQNFQKVLRALPEEMKQAFIDVEDMAAALCLNIAKKVIRKEVESKEHIITLIRDIIKDISDKTTLTIRMSPSDLRMLRDEGLELELAKDVTTLNIVEDMEIQRGGCVIEHNLGQVNAKIEDQISALERNIFNKYTSNAEESDKDNTAHSMEDVEKDEYMSSLSGMENQTPTLNVDIPDLDEPSSVNDQPETNIATEESLSTPPEIESKDEISEEITPDAEKNTPNVDLGTDNADTVGVDISGTDVPS